MPTITDRPVENLGKTVKPDDRVVLELSAFQRIQPAHTPFFAVCTGPYRMAFKEASCPECEFVSYQRQYQAKIVAIASLPSTEPDDGERAILGQMDSIAQAQHVINAKAWVTSRDPSARIGLAVVHSALPKWVLESSARIINDFQVINSEVISKVSFKSSVVGRKTLMHICPTCNAAMPPMHWKQDADEGGGTIKSALLDLFEQPLLYTWPVIVSELSQA